MKVTHWEQLIENIGLEVGFKKSLIANEKTSLGKLKILNSFFETENAKLRSAVDEYNKTGNRKLSHIIGRVEKAGIIPHEFIAVLALFNHDLGKIYRIGSDFGFELQMIDLKLELKYLPLRNKIICLEFPKEMKFQVKNEYCNGAYVYLSDEDSPGIKVKFDIFAPVYNQIDDSLLTDKCLHLSCDLYEDKTIEQSISEYENTFDKELSPLKGLVKFGLKCLLYISSGDPDLRHSMKKQNGARKGKSKGLIPKTILVGFLYKKTKSFLAGQDSINDFKWEMPTEESGKLILATGKFDSKVENAKTSPTIVTSKLGRPKKMDLPHQILNGVKHKQCCLCESWKPIESFSKRSTAPDGLQKHCKECAQKHYEENKSAYVERAQQRHKKLRDGVTPKQRGRKGAATEVIAGIKHKQCVVCEKMLPLNKFYTHSKASDGLTSDCIECNLARQKERASRS